MELVMEATAAEEGSGGADSADNSAARDAVRDEVVHSWSADVAASDGEGTLRATRQTTYYRYAYIYFVRILLTI